MIGLWRSICKKKKCSKDKVKINPLKGLKCRLKIIKTFRMIIIVYRTNIKINELKTKKNISFILSFLFGKNYFFSISFCESF